MFVRAESAGGELQSGNKGALLGGALASKAEHVTQHEVMSGLRVLSQAFLHCYHHFVSYLWPLPRLQGNLYLVTRLSCCLDCGPSRQRRRFTQPDVEKCVNATQLNLLSCCTS